ncbi:MAG: hypothetical protein RLZZ399_2388, partial [Verrucomicrobiota bacterium]
RNREKFREWGGRIEVGETMVRDREKAVREAEEKVRWIEDVARSIPAEFHGGERMAGPQWKEFSDGERAVRDSGEARRQAEASLGAAQERLHQAEAGLSSAILEITGKLAVTPFENPQALENALLGEAECGRLRELKRRQREMEVELDAHDARVRAELERLGGMEVPSLERMGELKEAMVSIRAKAEEAVRSLALTQRELEEDEERRQRQRSGIEEIAAERERIRPWMQLRELIGSKEGDKFRTYAQSISLGVLVGAANRHLEQLSDRYRMRQRVDERLALEMEDRHQAGVRRPMESLSGGESFLASLALALGLADMAGQRMRLDSLFIDEGFGTLDSHTLETALGALEGLQRYGKTVGVISHVELLKERIPHQIVVEKGAGGVSQLRVVC